MENKGYPKVLYHYASMEKGTSILKHKKIRLSDITKSNDVKEMSIFFPDLFDEMLKNYKTKMVLQIHDELIFKVPKDEKGIIEDKIIEIMENALKLKCRLKVEGSSAFCWYDAK